MAYVRSRSGSRTRFLPPKLAEIISLAYVRSYGPETPEYRQEIIELVDIIIHRLEKDYGNDAQADWPRSAIRKAIEQGLKEFEQLEVLENYIKQNPSTPKNNVVDPASDNPFNQKQAGLISYFENEDQYDPFWNILNSSYLTSPTPPSEIDAVGFLLTATPPKKPPTQSKNISKNRTQWWSWITEESIRHHCPINPDILRKFPTEHSEKPITSTEEEWYHFWKYLFRTAWIHDLNFYTLARVMQHRYATSRLLGKSWLHGSGLNEAPEDPPFEYELDPLSSDHTSYRQLWREHFGRLFQHAHMDERLSKTYNLDDFMLLLKPERDLLIDLRGFRTLHQNGGIWKIPSGYQWKCGTQWITQHDALEPPQWMWMRVALTMALAEPHPVEMAKTFYELLSTLSIIPSEAILRQAGLKNPNFLEDQSTRVDDQFESIYTTICKAAIDTKWTGTTILDWRRVRSKGSPIRGTLRTSQGIIPFISMLEDAIQAQGRTTETPIHCVLPIWHMEAISFISLKVKQAPHLQIVVAISQLFMDRVKHDAPWTLFDPAHFPEMKSGTPDEYLHCESLILERKKINRNCCKTMSSQKIWNLLLKMGQSGYTYIIFETNAELSTLSLQELPPVYGIDGVGCIPLPFDGQKWTAWPAMALNIKQCMDSNHRPQLDLIKHNTSIAIRFLDNAIMLSPQGPLYERTIRPACLGIVGLNETLFLAAKNNTDDSDTWLSSLCESISAAVVYADQQLVKERGPAPIWSRLNAHTVFNPATFHKKLQNVYQHDTGDLSTTYNWHAMEEKITERGYRLSARMVFAPYQPMADIAQVTPGGLGSLSLFQEHHYDIPWVEPTPALLFYSQHLMKEQNTETLLQHHQSPDKWPKLLMDISNPTPEGWRKLLLRSEIIRPWMDQGLCLTLPDGLPLDSLNMIYQQAALNGVTSIRFELKPKKNIQENDKSE